MAEPPRRELVAALEKLRSDFSADDGELLAAVGALPKRNDNRAALLALPRRRGRRDAAGDNKMLWMMHFAVGKGERAWPAARRLLLAAGVPADRRDEAARRLCRKFRDPRRREYFEAMEEIAEKFAALARRVVEEQRRLDDQQALGEIRLNDR